MAHLALARISIRAGLVALAAASMLRAAPAEAGPLIPTGSVSFGGFHDNSGTGGYIDASCNTAFTPTGSAVCSGPVLGDLNVVIGTANGGGLVSGGPSGGAPVVTSHIDVMSSGGDPPAGAGGNIVETVAQYFVSLGQIAPPPSSTTTVPLIFTDAGSVTGSASSNEKVSGEASTAVSARNGTINGTFFDHVATFSLGGSMSATYGNTHSAAFLLASDPVAQVDLDAICIFQSQHVGPGQGLCDAAADPFIGFDQVAFDLLMGLSTYRLSDFFQIMISPGFEPETPGPAVPEPGTLALFATGLAVLRVLRPTSRRRLRSRARQRPSC